MATLRSRRKKPTLILAVGLTLLGTGVAVAYWSASGNAAGEAETDVAVAFTVTTSDREGPLLAPGRLPGQTVAFTVANVDGTGAQQLAAVTARVANADGSTWTAVTGCSALDYTVTVTTNPAPVTLAPGEDADGVATITMNNLDSNQDACQQELVPLYFDTVVPN